MSELSILEQMIWGRKKLESNAPSIPRPIPVPVSASIDGLWTYFQFNFSWCSSDLALHLKKEIYNTIINE